MSNILTPAVFFIGSTLVPYCARGACDAFHNRAQSWQKLFQLCNKGTARKANLPRGKTKAGQQNQVSCTKEVDAKE